MRREITLQTRVGPEIEKIVKRLAKARGMSVSEYLRFLVVSHLDSRMIFKDNEVLNSIGGACNE
jgi:hypothetical protein